MTAKTEIPKGSQSERKRERTMTSSTSGRSKMSLIEEYRAAFDRLPQEAAELGLRLTVKTVQALSRGRPIARSELVDLWGMPPGPVNDVLEASVTAGQAEVDPEGRLVGGVLTLDPTDHQITFGDRTVFAWCSFDALWAPAVVGETARIRSTDPVTGGTIDLTVSPSGVEDVRPAEAVVTVVGADAAADGGRDSPRCTHMLFFESRASALEWTDEVPGVAILTPAEAREIAEASVVDRARSIGLV